MKINKNLFLGVASMIGVCATAYFTHRSTLKAEEIIKNKKLNKEDKKEIIKETYKVYIPAIVAGGATVCCIASNMIINKQIQAGLIAAGGLLAKNHQKVLDKIKDVYGQEALDTIKNDIAVESLSEKESMAEDNNAPEIVVNEFPFTYLGKDDSANKLLFYDSFSDRWFWARLAEVISAEYHLNRKFAIDGCATLSNFYEFLGLEIYSSDSYRGWEIDDHRYVIDFDNEECTDEGGNKYYYISATVTPDVIDDKHVGL